MLCQHISAALSPHTVPINFLSSCEGNQSAPQACPQGSANQITGQINSSACEVSAY